jgi:hypothetical protein
MKKLPFILALLYIIGLHHELSAQKRALGMPAEFEAPKDLHPDERAMSVFLEQTASKSRTDPWLVFSDRAENRVFDRPNGNAIGTIGFRDPFYVVEEKEGWVKIIEARMNGLKIEELIRNVGWVPKSKLLLWNRGLVEWKTRIHRKVLLLNRADAIDEVIRGDKDIVEVYTGPNTNERAGDLRIFSFFYVLKKEGNMILISSEAELPPVYKDKIIGWVRQSRCSRWDNRICLEPNYEEAAFAERKGSANRQIHAFGDLPAARAFIQSNGSNAARVFWNEDPVTLSPDRLAPSNPRRFRGDVIRFPMVAAVGEEQGQLYYQSGMIGSIQTRQSKSGLDGGVISEVTYSKILERIKAIGHKSRHLNVFFVTEGTACNYANQQQLVESVRNVKQQLLADIPNVRYGALLYRGLGELELDRLTEISPLHSDADKVIQFFSKADFQNKQSQGDWTALYFGLSEALRRGGFNREETNIILLVGCSGDFKVNTVLRNFAEKNAPKALFEDPSAIVASLSEIDAHLYAIQVRNDNSTAYRSFAAISRNLILEAAKFAYNKGPGSNSPESQALRTEFQQKSGMDIPEPRMEELSSSNDLPLTGAVLPGRLRKPAAGHTLSSAQLSETILQNIKESADFNLELYRKLSSMFSDGQSFFEIMEEESDLDKAAGRFLAPFIQFLNDLLTKSQIDRADIIKGFDEKYKLFTEVYMPHQALGSKYPLVSYAVMMPHNDLIEYSRLIKQCLVDAKTYPDKRKQLFEIHANLIQQFTGEPLDKRTEKYTRGDIFRLMQGLKISGLQLQCEQWNRPIKDLLNEKIVSNHEIDAIIQHYIDVDARLTTILRLGPNYDFCFQSEGENLYFWIPACEVF